MFSYSCPNIAVKCKRVHLISSLFLCIFFFLQNDVEAPAYLRTPGYNSIEELSNSIRELQFN